jgi:hypothetical protein
MNLKALFESNLGETVMDLLIKHNTSIFVQYPFTHYEINAGTHHLVGELSQEIISHTSGTPKGQDTAIQQQIQFSEKWQQRMNATNSLILVLHQWQYDSENRLSTALEAVGCSFRKPVEEPAFHSDDQFGTVESKSATIEVTAENVTTDSGEQVTWWPPEAIEALHKFRQDIIDKVKQDLTWHYDQKRDFWSK